MLHNRINRYGKMQINQFNSKTNTTGIQETLILTMQNILHTVCFYFTPSFSKKMKTDSFCFIF